MQSLKNKDNWHSTLHQEAATGEGYNPLVHDYENGYKGPIYQDPG